MTVTELQFETVGRQVDFRPVGREIGARQFQFQSGELVFAVDRVGTTFSPGRNYSIVDADTNTPVNL